MFDASKTQLLRLYTWSYKRPSSIKLHKVSSVAKCPHNICTKMISVIANQRKMITSIGHLQVQVVNAFWIWQDSVLKW